MSVRIFTLGAALLVTALPLAAQERGTISLGGMIGHTVFENSAQLDNAVGFGARVGAFLDPRWALEFEGYGGTAGRPSGLSDRTFRFIDTRITLVPMKVGVASIIFGAGVSHVDAHVSSTSDEQSYQAHALVGGKLAMGSSGALRLDGVQYFNAGATHRTIRLGVDLYRHPRGRETTVFQTTQAPAMPQRPDSVSAEETRRLRAADAALRALRDSLARNRPAAGLPPQGAAGSVSPAGLSTMLEMIHFGNDEAMLDATSRAILRDKVPIFAANPQMRIVITGYASTPGTAAHNMALGMRRAEAARAYLISQGVRAEQIEIATLGEGNLKVEGPGEVADAANRRGQFRILVTDASLNRP